MDPAAILKRAPHASAVRRVARLAAAASFALAALAQGASAQDAVDRYRELSLSLMVSEGAGREWAERLAPEAFAADLQAGADESLAPPVPVAALETPLHRIAEQREAIADAARIFRFAAEREADIEAELARIAADDPAGVAALDPATLAEDALLIRSALASSIEFLGRQGQPSWLDGLDPYRERTVYLRNMLEYWSFDQELAAITADALRDTGARMEAYQRLLEVDPRYDAFTQHLRAVEFIYRQYGSKIKPPDDPSDELIDSASKVD